VRFDRLITLGLVRPCRRLLRLRPSARHFPVLMYHSISADPEPGFAPYYKVCTSPTRFTGQMQWLADHGWRGVGITEGLAAIRGPKAGGAAQEKLVGITFDDGFRDFLTEAFPVLRRHGFSATMYLPTNFIADSPRPFKSRECLTWPEVAGLHRAGIEFGSHTASHPELVRLDWPQIERELRDSRAAIASRLGSPVPAFAYPFAFPQADEKFAASFREALRTAGYESCVTTEIGIVAPGDNPLGLRRLPANDCDDSALLRAKLDGDYDWLRLPQLLSKRAKAMLLRPKRISAEKQQTP
jgi:peptidoglycan/xylan/chitin deacetylase (PgdA/CDA1 family)